MTGVVIDMAKTMTIPEASQALGVSQRTIHRWIRDGKLSAKKIDRQWRVDVDIETVKDNGKSDLDAQLVEQLRSENAHIREQLVRRDEQIDHLTQVVAMSQKNIGALTEQLDDSRQMIEDMRSRSWWRRIFRR